MAGVKQTCAEFVSEFSNKLNKVTEDIAALVEILKGHIGDLEKEVGLQKCTVGNTSWAEDGHWKFKVPEPKAHNKTQNAKKLENFLWIWSSIFELLVYLKRIGSLS